MQASAELQVPTSEAAAVQIVVQVTDDSKVTVSLGSLSLSSGADTVQLVMGAQQAACLGMDGTCLVTLASSRRNLETGEKVQRQRHWSLAHVTTAIIGAVCSAQARRR